MKIVKNLSILSFIILGLIFSSSYAFAAETDGGEKWTAVPSALGPEAMTSLVSKFDQEQTDTLVKLMELLHSSATVEQNLTASKQAGMLETLEGWIAGFGDSLISNVRALPATIADAGSAIVEVFAGRGFGGSLLFLGSLALVIAISWGAGWLFNRAFPQRHQLVQVESKGALLETLKMLSLRAGIQLVDIIIFAIAYAVATKLVFSGLEDRFFALAVLKSILTVRLSAAILLFVLAPERADLRLVSTDGKTAKFLYRQLTGVAMIVALGFLFFGLMVHGKFENVQSFRFWVSFIVVFSIALLTWRARKGLTSIIIGDDENLTPGLVKMASWWPKISIIVIALDWIIIQFIVSTGSGAITPARGALSLALIVIMPFIDTMVRGISAHLVPPMEGSGPVAEKAHEESRHSYVRIGRIFLFITFILLTAKLLGFNLRELAASGLGTEIASHGLGFLLILAGGYIAMEVTNLWINRGLARELPDTGGDEEEGGAGQSRMATILPILRITLQVTIIIVTLLLALSQLGVNIAPLLAGAGVLGLAIGFGAQTLVKDVVSGVFFLLDDAFRMGEYVDVGGTLGSVEKISIRSLQLRDAKGPVHIVPYGSITKLSNMSRDWVIMKLKFIVPFDTDIEKVRKLFKKIGQQIMEESENADDLLAPFKSQGAADVTDVGIVIRGKFTAKPGGQWMIRREIYTRVQKAFEENGIEFARKEVRVQMPDSIDKTTLSPEQKKIIAAAASEAADTPS